MKVVGELDADEIKNAEDYGVYIGAHVPPHAIAVLLAFMARFRREFWVYRELHGLMKIHVDKAEPTVVEVPVNVEPLDLGREKRLIRLEKDHGYLLSRIYGKTVAVFGAGFIGSRIVELLAGCVGKVIVVDIDSGRPGKSRVSGSLYC